MINIGSKHLDELILQFKGEGERFEGYAGRKQELIETVESLLKTYDEDDGVGGVGMTNGGEEFRLQKMSDHIIKLKDLTDELYSFAPSINAKIDSQIKEVLVESGKKSTIALFIEELKKNEEAQVTV